MKKWLCYFVTAPNSRVPDGEVAKLMRLAEEAANTEITVRNEVALLRETTVHLQQIPFIRYNFLYGNVKPFYGKYSAK